MYICVAGELIVRWLSIFKMFAPPTIISVGAYSSERLMIRSSILSLSLLHYPDINFILL